jgi:hypothetical protein
MSGLIILRSERIWVLIWVLIMDAQTHWEKIYTDKAPNAVSWYRPHLEKSLELIEQATPTRSAAIIDVGGGESTLVDDLLNRGYENMISDPRATV